MKTIVIIVGVMALMAGAAFFITQQFIKPAVSSVTAEEPVEEEEESEEQEPGEVFLVSDLLVNPTGTGGTRYLSATIGLEVGSPEAILDLESRDASVRDLLMSILSSKTVDQLTDFTARETMREEIRTRLNALLKPEEVTAVYFVDYVLQ